jgi:predicted solute-binding protein
MREKIARIGCVPYLNARPLLEGITYPVSKLVPAQLFDAFQAGNFDAALLSSIDVLAFPYIEVADHISIASQGDVFSVILAYTGELQKITRVALDPDSHTSNALLQIIFQEFYQLKPEYVQFKDSKTDFSINSTARLLIGDQAISFRNRTSLSYVKILDLGGEWLTYTELPFVFALWAIKKEFTKKKSLSQELRMAKKRGLKHRQAIADQTSSPEFTLRYLSEWIRYDFGENEKKGLLKFSELLKKHSLIPDQTNDLIFL